MSVVNHYHLSCLSADITTEKTRYSSFVFVCLDDCFFLCLALCFKGSLLFEIGGRVLPEISLVLVVIATLFIGQDSLGGNHPLFGEMSSEISCGQWPRLWGYWSEVYCVKGALHPR